MDNNLSFADILRFIWRGLPAAIIAATIIGALTYFISRTLPAQYEARATVLAAQNTPDLRSFGVVTTAASALDVSAYRKAVLSNPVLKSVMTTLNLTDQSARAVDDFKSAINVHIEAANDSSLIDIIVTDASPAFAMNKANLLADTLVAWDANRANENLARVINTLEEQISLLETQIATLQSQRVNPDLILGRTNQLIQQQDQLAYARALSSSATGLLSIIEPALEPVTPSAPRPLFNTALAFLMTALLSYALLHFRESLSPGNIEDVAEDNNLPVLAKFPKLIGNTSRRLPVETTNYLRTNLLFATSKAQPKIILVTSSNQGEGKSSVAISLAESFVRNGSYTLLVDADLRQPSIAQEYKMLGSRLGHTSFETWLKNPGETRDVVRMPIAGEQELYVIPSFQPSAQSADLLSTSFRHCLESWKGEYDVIVIDSAPVLSVADTLSVAPFCTDTIMVVNGQKTQPRHLRSSLELLKRMGVHLTGIVATHAKEERTGFTEAPDASKQTSFKLPFAGSAEKDS